LKINAYDVAIPIGESDGYSFGMDPAKVITALQEMIEGIRSGRLIPQRASFETESEADNYSMSYLHMRFHEKR
jgi:hypothetical protein